MSTKEKEALMKELREAFEKAKTEIGFVSSFEEIDEIFFIKDRILSDGFVSENFPRQMCHRISDALGWWVGYLHSLLMPNPQSLTNLTEAKIFNEEERKKMKDLIKGAMALESLNILAEIEKDLTKNKEFIDGAVKFWKEKFKPGIAYVVRKINRGWSE